MHASGKVLFVKALLVVVKRIAKRGIVLLELCDCSGERCRVIQLFRRRKTSDEPQRLLEDRIVAVVLQGELAPAWADKEACVGREVFQPLNGRAVFGKRERDCHPGVLVHTPPLDSLAIQEHAEALLGIGVEYGPSLEGALQPGRIVGGDLAHEWGAGVDARLPGRELVNDFALERLLGRRFLCHR